MLTPIPSMTAGLAGALVTAVALAADWYIWDFRRRTSPQRVQELASLAHKQAIHLPSASGREVVATPVGRSAQTPAPAFQIQNQRPDLWAQY